MFIKFRIRFNCSLVFLSVIRILFNFYFVNTHTHAHSFTVHSSIILQLKYIDRIKTQTRTYTHIQKKFVFYFYSPLPLCLHSVVFFCCCWLVLFRWTVGKTQSAASLLQTCQDAFCALSLSLSHSLLFILWMAFFSIYAPEVYRVCTVPAVANCYQKEIIWKGWSPFTFFLFINNILGQFK